MVTLWLPMGAPSPWRTVVRGNSPFSCVLPVAMGPFFVGRKVTPILGNGLPSIVTVPEARAVLGPARPQPSTSRVTAVRRRKRIGIERTGIRWFDCKNGVVGVVGYLRIL